jgi:hypothetical protein
LTKDSVLLWRQFVTPFLFSFLDFLIHIYLILNLEKRSICPHPLPLFGDGRKQRT